MCDAAVSEDRDLLPDAGHELVGDVRRIHAVDRLTRDRVVREEHRVQLRRSTMPCMRGVRTPASRANSDTSASCSTVRRNDENGR